MARTGPVPPRDPVVRDVRGPRLSTDPASTLAACFTGPLAPYADLMRLDGDDAEVMPCEALVGEGACAVIARYAATTYPGADPRAVVSMWTQWYFGTLIVPTCAAILHLDRDLPVGLGEAGIAVGADGRPRSLVLAHAGTPYAPAGEGRFARLVRGHVDPLVCHLARTYGVSRRVLWTNAAVLLDWTMAQAEATGGACDAALAECRALLAERTDPCGRANPLCGMLCPASRMRGRRVEGDQAEGDQTDDRSDAVANRRRVCCLRYRLPGVPACGDLCPLTEAQRAVGAAQPCDA